MHVSVPLPSHPSRLWFVFAQKSSIESLRLPDVDRQKKRHNRRLNPFLPSQRASSVWPHPTLPQVNQYRSLSLPSPALQKNNKKASAKRLYFSFTYPHEIFLQVKMMNTWWEVRCLCSHTALWSFLHPITSSKTFPTILQPYTTTPSPTQVLWAQQHVLAPPPQPLLHPHTLLYGTRPGACQW